MRTIRHRSRSLLIVALGLVASTALAGPKKPAKPAGGGGKGSGGGSASGGDSGEIQMDDSGGGSGSGGGSAAGGGDAGGEIQMDDEKANQPGDLSADLQAADASNKPVQSDAIKKTPLSWKDITVVVRKPFLKVRRTELNPFVSTSMNDNMIRTYGMGGELAYYLTDVLAVGVEGQYFQHSFQDSFDLVARQARRLPTVNQYNWGTALDFHYVPVYGKFAVLDKHLITWESYFTAGIGVGQSEVIPRDPKFPGFTNFLIQPNLGVNLRFFLAKWLTINLGIRDYMFIDKFEPVNRDAMTNTTASMAQANADSAFINNIMFQIGVSFWLPTSFEYTTFR
jgi:outer membrane beta-barrel protein